MVHRPTVSVFSTSTEKRVGSTVMPKVFSTPLRSDLVHYVHTNMSKNKRQAYAVSKLSGYQTSARSWGTGRALSRTPRVKGGGTHRAGQAAYANFCRAGGMFAPTRTWRRWHRKVNLKERRLALSVAVASTSVVPLVMSRGHRVESLPELPLVLEDSVETLTKTRDAVALLNKLGLSDELARVSSARRTKRAGKKYPVGPLVVLRASAVEGRRAFRNIPGVEVASVERLNLLKLAPAGNLGRLVIWSKSAFESLDSVLRVESSRSTKGSTGLTNPDVTSLVNSTVVQSSLRPRKLPPRRVTVKKPHSRRLLRLLHNSVRAKKTVDKSARKERRAASKKFFRDVESALGSSEPLVLKLPE
ncbi:60S ribosomal protein L4/L1 [Theileria orientalis strain Shintoku]|uniref:60S ribosomal protein L4/L1 n=1 Tax=Theileria orientalis strain Shintoku TaxID=869250 RepID=J4C3E5_THEOR|nr:60S ribosomal protein L4/L1 [Theileria orientalis strain Shintoku]BAM40301.1 60S ribosomal protein L4/L1 [Theileria orientalis strain Shintoku]|eukprot:XP_009690602.1 60S ribosomal protein L4/L1 [Theileria orientalis strain Shintoku]